MVIREREEEGLIPRECEDPYSEITNPELLRRLNKYRTHLPGGEQSLYVASVLKALAEVEGLPKLSEDYYNLTRNFKAIFRRSRIVPMEKGVGKGLILDDTGADLLIALGYFYRVPTEEGLVTHNFTTIARRALDVVCANGRLASPLQRFLKDCSSKQKN